MPSPLTGTIVVVGASSGIGEALAVRLAHDARPVAILARRRDALERIAARANEKVGTTRVHVWEHDVTDRDGVAAVWEEIERELGTIDELHYVAGVMPEVALDRFPTDVDAQMLSVNTLGSMAWCNHAASVFLERRKGHILGVTSIAGLRGRRDRPGYNASKAAQDVHLEALRNRLWRHGVKVTTVRPGPVHTPMTEGMKVPLPVTAERCAEGIVKARDRSAAIAHVPWVWRPIMWVIRAIPSFVFRRLDI